MKYPRSNFDELFNFIKKSVKSDVIPVGSYGRGEHTCGDLDVCIKISDKYTGSDVFLDLLNAGFIMRRFKENDGGEIWLKNQICHVIFFTDNDCILKISRFLEGKHNLYSLWHELYKAGYKVNADEYRVFDKEGNEIMVTSLEQLEGMLNRPIRHKDIIVKVLTNYKLN